MSADLSMVGDDSGLASSSPIVRERHSLTLDQRRALRRWANSQTTRPSHKACIEWFRVQYNQTISQSTVSHSLSPKYARLDGDPQLSGSRLRFGNWPDVEKLVLLWHQQMVVHGRHPSNEELADKAKSIFQQLPRYKDEQAPEFSPGWIHRFKKRYGLLIRRQRRNTNQSDNIAEDIPYLVDAVPRFMTVSSETSPAAIRETVQRVVGVDPTLSTCARVRDEIIHRLDNPQVAAAALTAAAVAMAGEHDPHAHTHEPNGGHTHHDHDPQQHHDHDPQQHHSSDAANLFHHVDDPEDVLQGAIQQIQEEEAAAEADAALAREERDREAREADAEAQAQAQAAAQAAQAQAAAQAAMHGFPAVGGHQQAQLFAQQAAAVQQAQQQQTPVRSRASGLVATTPGPTPKMDVGGGAGGEVQQQDLTLTPIPSGGPVSTTDRPVRCPFCLNQRMLRTIKEAVEHMSTHVVV